MSWRRPLDERRWRRLYKDFSAADAAHTVSFDAFDTLITRPWFKPVDQFAILAAELHGFGLFSGSPSQWQELRQKYEMEARKRTSREDVSLREIYATLAEHLHWNDKQTALARNAEFQRELKDIRPIAHAMERMNRVRASGKDVIVTSDTYFSATELQQLLTNCGYNVPQKSLFASSEHSLTKGSGGLFSFILEQRGLAPRQLWHIGDHPWGDGQSPAKLGIGSTICNDYAPTRYERLFAKPDRADPIMSSAMAGCARVSRLARTFTDIHAQTIWNVGTNVAGPLLFAYTMWVLSRAQAQNINRVYFLARDGEILMQIAQHLCRWLNFTVECRYLYASRQSFSLPSLTEFNAESLGWIFNMHEHSTVRSILARVALTPNDVEGELARVGFCREDWDRALTSSDVNKLTAVIIDPAVAERILIKAKESREILNDYLRQEGLADNATWAICDVGWRGAIQRSLQKVTANVPGFSRPVKGFYFGLNKSELLIEKENAEAFEDDIKGLSWIIETFCGSEQGSVDHFAKDPDGIVRPVLKDEKDFAQIEWGVRLQRAAIIKFVEEFTATIRKDDFSMKRFISFAHERTIKSLRRMTSRPSAEEAEVFGGIEFAAEPTHQSTVELAPLRRADRLLIWIVLGHRSGLPSIDWPQASIARSIKRRALRAVFHAAYDCRTWQKRLRGNALSYLRSLKA